MEYDDILCDCGNECFTYYVVSKGVRAFRCNMKRSVGPCEFYREIKETDVCFDDIVLKKKDVMIKNKPSAHDEINHYIQSFKVNPLYSLFQQIEFKCKELNIPIYNHRKETIPMFIQRIEEHIK